MHVDYKILYQNVMQQMDNNQSKTLKLKEQYANKCEEYIHLQEKFTAYEEQAKGEIESMRQ